MKIAQLTQDQRELLLFGWKVCRKPLGAFIAITVVMHSFAGSRWSDSTIYGDTVALVILLFQLETMNRESAAWRMKNVEEIRAMLDQVSAAKDALERRRDEIFEAHRRLSERTGNSDQQTH